MHRTKQKADKEGETTRSPTIGKPVPRPLRHGEGNSCDGANRRGRRWRQWKYAIQERLRPLHPTAHLWRHARLFSARRRRGTGQAQGDLSRLYYSHFSVGSAVGTYLFTRCFLYCGTESRYGRYLFVSDLSFLGSRVVDSSAQVKQILNGIICKSAIL